MLGKIIRKVAPFTYFKEDFCQYNQNHIVLITQIYTKLKPVANDIYNLRPNNNMIDFRQIIPMYFLSLVVEDATNCSNISSSSIWYSKNIFFFCFVWSLQKFL